MDDLILEDESTTEEDNSESKRNYGNKTNESIELLTQRSLSGFGCIRKTSDLTNNSVISDVENNPSARALLTKSTKKSNVFRFKDFFGLVAFFRSQKGLTLTRKG